MTSTSDVQNSGTPQREPAYRVWLRGKTRIVLAWIFAAALIFSARQYPTLPGILICFFGATIRFWASGFLRKDSRPAVGGPYAMTRNPLYLGTYLMALGTAIAIENWWLLLIVSVIFAAIYHFIILDEEIKLAGIFGEPYELYKKSVPRFFPRLWPASRALLLKINPEHDHQRFDWPLAMRNRAYEAYAAFAAMIGFVALVAFAWQMLAA